MSTVNDMEDMTPLEKAKADISPLTANTKAIVKGAEAEAEKDSTKK